MQYEFQRDQTGKELHKDYSIIIDPSFERRLKMFDPELKLVFDQVTRKWVIMLWSGNRYNWYKLMTLEDNEGNPKPPGDWVLNKLYVWRQRALQRQKNPDKFLDDLLYQQEQMKKEMQRSVSEETQYQLKHDVNKWRKAMREMDNRPISDVTAGYAKIQPKTKANNVKKT